MQSLSSDDLLIPEIIDDTIQSMAFFPSRDINYLATGGWDSKLRIFDIKSEIINYPYNLEKANLSSKLINIIQNPTPILSLSWNEKTGNIFTGCLDGSLNMIDIQKNNFYKISQHNSGCKEVIYNNNLNLLFTGGWDGALHIWDLRSQNPIATYQFNNKIYTMSLGSNLLVLGLSELVMAYFDLNKLQQGKFEPEIFFKSHLKEQTKKVCAFTDGKGFAEGSIEGRVAIKFIDQKESPKIDENKTLHNDKNFAFKCHRGLVYDEVTIYQVNDICINPVYGSICTVGGDGNYFIWDINKRTKLGERSSADKTPLTSCSINRSGNILAFASGYDWSKGAIHAHEYERPKIWIHFLKNNERIKND